MGQNQLDDLSGVVLPVPIKIVNESMWFRFTSDRTIELTGFYLTWYTETRSTGSVYKELEIVRADFFFLSYFK